MVVPQQETIALKFVEMDSITTISSVTMGMLLTEMGAIVTALSNLIGHVRMELLIRGITVGDLILTLSWSLFLLTILC